MPRVTVLLTCYQHRRYLPAAVEGLRAQTYRDFETLALDDGSTDGSREWLAEQPDLKSVFNARNLGTYATLNEGLRLATGEMIAVLNDDDVWLPEKLERQVTLLDAHETVGLVHTGGHFVDGDGNRTEGNPLGFRFPTFDTGDILPGLVYENKVIASAALVRRACFDAVGEFNPSYFGSGDWEMWWRVCERYAAGFVDAPLTLYRVHGANASHKLERIWQDDERLREFFAERIDALDGRIDQKGAAFNLAALGTVKMLNGKSFEAREAYKASLRRDPRRPQTLLRLLATYLGRDAFRRTLRW